MEIKYSKNDLKELIKKYYQEMEGRNVEVSITAKSELVGFYGTNTCITTKTIKENIELLGRNVQVKEILTKEDVHNILSTMLESNGYILNYLEYDDGIKTECVGYFMNEHMENKPYFNGVIINIRKNTLAKRL